MLTEQEIEIITQVINATNFRGEDVSVIHNLKLKLQAIKEEAGKQKEQKPN